MSNVFTNDPAALNDRKAYAKNLQRAFDKVTSQPDTHEFLYYPKFTFADKKVAPLILVAFEPKLPAALKSEQSLSPTVKGFVSLTPKEELDFAMEKGALSSSALAAVLKNHSIRQAVFDGDAKTAEPAKAPEPAKAAQPAAPVMNAVQPASTAPAAKPQAHGSAPAGTESKGRDQEKEKAETKALLDRVMDAFCLPADAGTKSGYMKAAIEAMKGRDFHKARALLAAFEQKHPQPATPKPALPAAPLTPADKALANLGADDDLDAVFDLSKPALSLDKKEFGAAALAPSSAVANAQQALVAEEEAFLRRKTVRKVEKIKASISETAKADEERLAKEEEKKRKEAEKAAKGETTFGQRLADAGGKVISAGGKVLNADKKVMEAGARLGGKMLETVGMKEKEAKEPKEPVNRIDQSQANKKADDELKKINTPLPAVGAAGTLDSRVAKGLNSALDSGNQGDDIASAAGTVAAATAGAASSVLDVVRAMKLWKNTTGAERSVHLREAAEAMGAVVGNLVNISKGSVNIAKHSNAVEAGATVPILGIVAAVPALIAELNTLRSAIVRLAKQQKMFSELEKAVDGGDTSQATLYTLVSGFMDRDSENIGKGIARVALDLTKIAGHGVTAGGITGPLGVAMVGVGTAGKMLMSAADGVQGLVVAHQANDRRKKLQPTLHAKREWDALPKDKPGAPENKALTAAIDALALAEKGTPAHVDALGKLIAAAETFKKANAASPKGLAYATQLIDQAKAEKQSWERDDDADDADPLKQKKGNALTPQEAQHRDARKLMARDPRLAAQTLLDQAIREKAPGGPAFQVLKSFGIEASQVYGPETGDDRIASNREMRQKVLYKMGADDETALTLKQTVNETKDSVVGYLSVRSKHAELDAYMKAKNLLKHGGEAKRSKGWQLKMDLLTDDVEEKKATLLAQLEHLVAAKDIDAYVADQARALLMPRDEKKLVAA